ncbi:30S ribosomal protein S16 [Candidatus Promineifilum breve]|uniref:Small ribosomal subunit protein bS16 n=1 Tax=Candidatus Promineifilum breve TaxID=1806508 RepID=A0A160T1I7_9CHLR|nr:30S ribosomal protein S16 [Candidatus Promineifilum breve]CUS02240.2 30S ribosomal protein S16 [Candidatus Promineifilum breve]
MLRIRLSRKGKKRQPSYRVVVAEKESKRDGRIVENIGHYNPLTNPPTFLIEEARALHWLSVGAQPSDAVRILLNKQGTFDRLARVHAGESIDALVGEYQGVEVAEVAKAAPVAAKTPAPVVAEEPAPSLVAEVSEKVGDAVQVVAAPVASAVDTVKEAVEAAVERVTDAIEAVLDADEEE